FTSYFFFSSRRRHTRWPRDWSSDVCSSDLDSNNNRVVEVSSTGAVVQVLTGFTSPEWVALDAAGRLYVASNDAAGTVRRQAPDEIGRASCRERVEIWEVGV